MKTFVMTEQHIKLLRHACVRWENCEFGAPAIDCKRPYGNSDAYGDMAEILGLELFEDADGEAHISREQRAMMDSLHAETETALQVILKTGRMEPGTYISDNYMQNWKPVR